MILQEDICRDCALKKCGNIFRVLRCFLWDPGNQAVIIFRFGHWLYTRPRFVQRLLYVPYILMHRRIRWKWGIEIVTKATIGPGFHVFHYGGIFIDGNAIIGKNFTITQNVVIGTRGIGENDEAPHIGDNVSVSPGANISGAIRIGNNVRIGPNAVVTKNIPDNALVHSVPPRVVVFPGRYESPGT